MGQKIHCRKQNLFTQRLKDKSIFPTLNKYTTVDQMMTMVSMMFPYKVRHRKSPVVHFDRRPFLL